jgi:hypothetical protein
MTLSHSIAVALCVLGSLTGAAHGSNINGEATYISFSVPGALGTYPMSINASMTVTGYYYVAHVTPTYLRGFVRAADGAITTFDVGVPFGIEEGTVWTVPESINAAGDITGFYQYPPVGPPGDTWGEIAPVEGFLRYADGHTIDIAPNESVGGDPGGEDFLPIAQPVSINDLDEVVGNAPYLNPVSVFTWSVGGLYGVYKDGISFNKLTLATAINASGSVVGFSGSTSTPARGFVRPPDGVAAPVNVPSPAPQSCAADGTFPEGINAGGTIAGWYVSSTDNCTPASTGGFVMSPDGVFSLFQPPGMLLALPVGGFGGSLLAPHSISIDQAGNVAGSYTDAGGVKHGFVRNPYGTLTTFDPPEGNQTTATSIADGGLVAGYYQYHSGGPAVGFIRVP